MNLGFLNLCLLLSIIVNVQPSYVRFNGKQIKPSDKKLGDPVENYYDQLLDHFDTTKTTTWKQRYFINQDFYKNGEKAPVFLLISGESVADPFFVSSGFMVEQAAIYGALVVMLEHRFYGPSIPTRDVSTASLKYLSADQALEDLATFREFIHSKYKLTDNNKWIAFGCSYPGSLAAWIREKYPHLIYASFSGSAPIKAKLDFFEYLEVTNQALSRYSADCPKNIKTAINAIDELVKTKTGKAQLKKLFQTCETLITNEDISTFYLSINSPFVVAVQYNSLNQEGKTIEFNCKIMNDATLGDELTRLATTVKTSYKVLGTAGCWKSSYSNYLKNFKGTKHNKENPDTVRPWTYQTCSEFGYQQTSGSTSQSFGSSYPISYFTKFCKDVFGAAFTPTVQQAAVDATNIRFGGSKFSGTNVFFSYGSLDPWTALGLTSAPSGNSLYVMDGISHCADEYGTDDSEAEQIKLSKQKKAAFLQNLLA